METDPGKKKEPDEFLAFCLDMGKGLLGMGRDAAGMGRDAAVSGVSGAGKLFAAICSLCVPGFGQLLQGRFGAAIAFLFFGLVLWFFMLGWIIHIVAALDALLQAPRRAPPS